MPRLHLALSAVFMLLLLASAPVIGHSIFSLRSQVRGKSRQVVNEKLRGRRLQVVTSQPCARSWLGYQCTQLACGRIRIHWSLGGDPPTGPGCSYSQNLTLAGSPDPAAQLLHVALQTDLTGYVALSWPSVTGSMYPADAVIGFQDDSGKPSVAAYQIKGFRPSDVHPDGSVDIFHTGLEVNATALTICFTRNITQVGPAASVKITTQAPVGMNFAASKDAFSTRHSLSKNYLCGASFSLYRAAGGPDDGGWRPTNVSGNADNVFSERLRYMRTHGALQFTGWIVLVPIGIFAARHRWLFAPASVLGLWFQVHRAVQMLAVVLIVAGFILPWTSFDSADEQEVLGDDHEANMASDPLLECHQTLALGLMAALGLHVVVAILRPKPDAQWRWFWNQFHWWTGRVLAVLAGVNVAIGITLWRRVSGGSGIEWIVPLVLFAGAWVGLGVWLERRAPQGLGRDGGSNAASGLAVTTSGYVLGSLGSSPSVPSPTGNVALSRLTETKVSNGVEYNKL